MDGGPRALTRPRSIYYFQSLALLALLAARVFVDFHGVRAKVIRTSTSAVSDTIAFEPPAGSAIRTAERPLAAVVRIRNEGATSAFVLGADEGPICSHVIEGGATARIDCAVQGESVRFFVKGPAPPWSIEYAEIATHHGGTAAPYQLLILPRHRSFPRPHIAVLIAAALTFILIGRVPAAAIRRRWIRLAYATVVCLAGLLSLLALLSPWVGPFKIVISFRAWLYVTALLLTPRVVTLAARVAREDRLRRHRRLIAALAIVLVSAGVFARATLRAVELFHQGNYSGFIHLSPRWIEKSPVALDRPDVAASLRLEDTGGYDAQFMYFAMFDPLVTRWRDQPERYRDFIDSPPYRLGRIGFAWLTRALSLNRPMNYPVVMIWLIVAAVTASVAGFCAIAALVGRSMWWGLAGLVVPGFWICLQYSMPEPIAAALLIWGFFFRLRGQWIAAGVLFACAMLVRETVAVAILCAALSGFVGGNRRAAILMLLLALTPWLAWRIYLGSVLHPAFGFDAYFYNPHIHGMPGGGLFEMYSAVARGEYWNARLTRAVVAFSLLFLAAGALSVIVAIRERSIHGLMPVLYVAPALCLIYPQMWDHVANVERGTYEIFVVLSLALLMRQRPSKALTAASAGFIAASAAYVLFGSIDAEFWYDSLVTSVWR